MTPSDTPAPQPVAVKKRGQLELALQTKARWGGRRPGAGRKHGPRPPVPHASRHELDGEQPCLVTLRVREDVGSLGRAGVVRALERAFAEGCERGDLRLTHYVFLVGWRRHGLIDPAALVRARGRATLPRGIQSGGVA